MALEVDRLSLWEIAHRWHNVDPYLSRTITDVPLVVKDQLRNLASEVYSERLYSNLRLNREAGSDDDLFGRPHRFLFWKRTSIKRSIRHHSSEFNALIHQNIINIEFLKSVKIPYWEFEFWCNEFNIPFPGFWKSPVWRGGKEKSKHHQDAAYKKNEAINKLKQDCVIFSISRTGSKNQIAKQFYNSLPEERKILAPTNAIRTLAQGLSDYKKGADIPWINELKKNELNR